MRARSRMAVVVVVLAVCGIAAAEETVEQCEDRTEHPTAESRAYCLNGSSDARAILALNRMAREASKKKRGEGGGPSDRELADRAGEVALRSGDSTLLELLRSSDPLDQVFAMAALEGTILHVDERRAASLAAAMRRYCAPLVTAPMPQLRAEAERCMDAAVGPGAPGSSEAPAASLGSSHFPSGGLAGIAKGGGGLRADGPIVRVQLACLQGAVGNGVEVCFPDMPALEQVYYLPVSASRHPGRATVGEVWRRESPGAPDHEFIGTVALRLAARERIAPRGLRVLGRSGDRVLVAISVVQRPSTRDARTRVVLAVLDLAASGWAEKTWDSAACEGACREPRVEISAGPGAREIRVRTAGTGGDRVERVRWRGDQLEPIAEVVAPGRDAR